MTKASTISEVPGRSRPLRRGAGRRRSRSVVHGVLAVALTLAAGLAVTATTTGTAVASQARPAPVVLGAAADFGVLGAATVTNTGATAVSGDVGVSPGTAITGFPPGVVTNGSLEPGTATATAAHAAVATAYNDAAGRAAATISATLGGQTLVPGVYTAAVPALTLAGTLTLDAQGDPNAVFIIQAGTTLTTAANSAVTLTGSASACNVFWELGTSATLGVGSALAGTVLAGASVTATSGVTIDGRVLARTAAVTLDTATITTPHCSTVALTTSAVSVRFGSPVTLTAAVTPSSATGSVVFSDVPSTGPDSGTTVDLGTGTLSAGVATLTITPASFGLHTVVATYGGDSTNRSAASPEATVEVSAYAGEVIVREFRTSGAGGNTDSYVELYNTGAPVPLAGFVVSTSATDSVVVPASTGTVGTGRSYLLTGAGYSLSAVSAADDAGVLATANFAGVKVQAPDSAGTRTDAVGNTNGFRSGTALSTLSGSPGGQWAWVRLESAGVPVNSGSNAADFKLVSTSGASIGGAQSTVGSPAPLASGSVLQRNGVLKSTLLNPSAAATSNPNFTYNGTTKVLVVRRTITNTSGATLTSAVVRITSLSEPNGAPEPGVASQPATPAWLQFINPATATSTVTVSPGRGALVQNLTMNSPATSSPGGGLNTTFQVPLPVGGLVNGASVNVAFTFKVSRGGIYWFGYDIGATSGAAAPAVTAHLNLPGRHSLSRSSPQVLGPLSDAGARGLLR